MIIEYNPLHSGHLYLVEEMRRRLGQDTAVVGVMSGDFVQRGDFAVVRRQARAKAAVESGVDLVLELPLPWAVGSAERFADGGVGVLEATGVVDNLAFGSECGDAAVLQRLASVLHSEGFPQMLKEELATGVSFAAARQRAVERLMGVEEAAVLENPNNILGVDRKTKGNRIPRDGTAGTDAFRHPAAGSSAQRGTGNRFDSDGSRHARCV